MFFSIIIPTYNPKDYLPVLLTSIQRNNCINDIEIIISDDCSDENFDDVLTSFSKLNIYKIQNEKHEGFPRLGRQNGVQKATGQWICFADQDDYYVDNGFDKIKNYIIDNNISNYLASDFIKHQEGTDEYIIMSGTHGWTHGKFYEKTFLDKYNLSYDDIQYCEDVNLSTKIGCVLIEENIPSNICHEPIYIWNQRGDSLSQRADYFANSMPDYITGTIGVIIDHINKFKYNNDIADKLITKFFQTLFHIYFYSQSNVLYPDKRNALRIATTLLPICERFTSITNITAKDIVDKTYTEYQDIFAEARNNDYVQIPFIEHITFENWIFTYLN